jgi:hypothetical protein
LGFSTGPAASAPPWVFSGLEGLGDAARIDGPRSLSCGRPVPPSIGDRMNG